MTALFAFERGSGGVPVVLLHGFGMSHRAWDAVLHRLDPAQRVLAFDLPGHAGSLGVPHGSAAVAAKAVIADLERRGFARAHFVGHSMGGAVAALIALFDPARALSLILPSPGGFGPGINADLLRRYAAAVEAEEIAPLLPPFFGRGGPPEGLAAAIASERQAPGATAALSAIVETFFDGAQQKTLPLAELARLDMPISVLWGREDGVLPVTQAETLSDRFSVRLFDAVGHMLPFEIPDAIVRAIAES